MTYFEDPWVKERERRNSFGRDSGMKESADHGRSNKSVDQSHLLYGRCQVFCLTSHRTNVQYVLGITNNLPYQ